MNKKELTELCGKVRDKSITDGDVERLEEILRQDREARRFYLRFLQLDAMLEKVAPAVEEWDSLRPNPIQSVAKRNAAGWLAIAAAVVLFAAGWLLHSLMPSHQATGSSPTATLVLVEDCRWKKGSPAEGAQLGEDTLELVSGTAVLRFAGGAEAVLTGPVAMQITGPAGASLQYGEVVIRAENGAEGFRLSTPRGELIDLGTEFAVRVGDNGETELHVHEGEVAIGEDFATGSEKVIREGSAVKLRDRSGAFTTVALDAPRFQELIARAGPREQRDRMTAYEGFHTDPGTYAPGDLDLGRGWQGAWRSRSPSEVQGHLREASEEMTVAHSQMDVVWPIRGGKAGMLEMEPGSSVWIRKMSEPIRTGEKAIRYFSFLVTEPDLEVTRDEKGKLRWHALRFTLRSSADYFGESLSIGWGRDQQPRVAAGFDATARTLRKIPAGTVFCVAKIMTRRKGEDRVLFRFYTGEDKLDLVEPAEWDVRLGDLDLSADLDLLVLTSNAVETRYVDEIRFGPSWRSVTPVDTPALLSTVKNRTGE